MKKVILSILISILLIYLSVQGTDFHAVVAGMEKITYGYILLFILIACLMQLLRAWRWGLILTPLGKIGHLLLIAVTNVGFLAITALPARLGELGRPYLLSRNSSIKMSAALGTVFVERILDGIAILAIASIVPFFTILPSWLIRANVFFFLINIALIAVVWFAVFRRDRMGNFLYFFLRLFTSKWEKILNQIIEHFLDGFRIIGNGRQFFQIMMLSFLIWLIDVLAILTLFKAFHFSLPPVSAVVLMLILIIGIAIPTAPGFIGNWHFSCVLGLGFFGIAKTDALTFAIIYHFLAIGIVVILGLCSSPYLNYSFTELWKTTRSV